ncbi:hypothetical protein BDV98DRAFT_554877 [Pterulicium gracile]|uniref:Thioester reductase (TE) domain-containing protein n=1 Tax=Pterulicium gracile TaxID=1884261 RepID=A0A5C3Q4M4_9AGAR|nr:hypothetical protein BDV98DRAFT_554877 [Pterula gracilis]
MATPDPEHINAIQQAISKYSKGLVQESPSHIEYLATSPTTTFTVLLTGSTGNLGTHILAYLLEHPSVDHVFVHNRVSSSNLSSLQRHETQFTEHGLNHDLLHDKKLTFLEGDLRAPQLGLAQQEYDELLSIANVVIHNAWKSNFKFTLHDYEPFIIGSRNLIDFALAVKCSSKMRFVFTSSMASVQSWTKGGDLVPETSLSDASIAAGSGYGESKYVVERLLQCSGLNSSTLRIVQLSGGDETGYWSTDEWIPGLIRSSVALGIFPSSEALVPWVSLSDAARIIIDDALGSNLFVEAAVYNMEHPSPVPWNAIVCHLNEALVQRGVIPSPLPIVPVPQWIDKLHSAAAKSDSQTVLRELPAVRILRLFEFVFISTRGKNPRLGDHAALDTSKLMSRSETMRAMKPLGKEDAALWAEYWLSKGYFQRSVADRSQTKRYRATL